MTEIIVTLPQLPKGWVWTRIGEISENIQYGTSEKAGKDVEGIPVLRMGNIQEGEISFEDLRYFPSTWPNLNHFVLQPGDVLFNRTNSAELVGKSAVYKEHHPRAVFASYLIRIRPNADFYSPHILAYFINSLYGRKYIASVVSQQVGQANVNGKKLSQMPIPLIPRNEQSRILAKIEELFALLGAGLEALGKVKAQLKRYRQAVLKYAFEGKLTEEWRKTHRDELEPASKLLERTRQQRGVDKRRNTYSMEENLPKLPDEWTWTTIGELAEINPRLTNENLPADLEVSFLPMKAVEEKTGRFDSSIVRKYEEVKRGYTSFKDGDVLFAKITPCMENGKIAAVEKLRNGIGFGSTEFHVIRPRANEAPKKLFFYYLLMDGFREDAQKNMTGSAGQLRVSARYLQNAAIPLCSFEEQHRIVEEIESRFSITEEVAKILDTTLLHSEQMRQSILKTAFEGKLVPQNPHDEPAEKLLERIRAERKKPKGEKDTNRKNKSRLELSTYVK